MTEIELAGYVDEARVMALREGDVIVVYSKRKLTREQAEALKAHVEGEFPGHKALVVTEGLRLELIRGDGEGTDG